jgi:HD-GYP domain-containing protein (c-di-GMP phosphodiesterase class II)
MLKEIDYLQVALEIPFYHHEKWDGTGYPNGLKGEEIPIAARIFAIVDVWDAMTNDRPYRKAIPHDEVISYLMEQSGRHFDPKIVNIFIRILNAPKKNNE